MRLDRIARRAHDTEDTAFLWHALHATLAGATLFLVVGELYYHTWAARWHWRRSKEIS